MEITKAGRRYSSPNIACVSFFSTRVLEQQYFNNAVCFEAIPLPSQTRPGTADATLDASDAILCLTAGIPTQKQFSSTSRMNEHNSQSYLKRYDTIYDTQSITSSLSTVSRQGNSVLCECPDWGNPGTIYDSRGFYVHDEICSYLHDSR